MAAYSQGSTVARSCSGSLLRQGGGGGSAPEGILCLLVPHHYSGWLSAQFAESRQ